MKTHTFAGPGCPACGALFPSHAAATTHTCDPATHAAWQATLAAQLAPPVPAHLTDLGNWFVLNLPKASPTHRGSSEPQKGMPYGRDRR